MHVYIHALGGQRNAGQLGSLLLALGSGGLGGGLSLMLRVHRILCHPHHSLLFLVAGDKSHGQQQGHAKKSTCF